VHKRPEGRLSVDWKKIKAEYIAGGTSYRRLAEKYDVPFGTLRRVAEREEWTQMRTRAAQKADTKMLEAISKQEAKIDDRYYRLVDKLMQKAEETIENTPVWSINGLKEMATAMKYLKECKGVKSAADMREQEARIAKLQKEAQEENKDSEIQIIIGSDAEEYSI
jgi:hypothetical protein